MSLHDLLQSVLVNVVVHLVLLVFLDPYVFHFGGLRSRQVFQIQYRRYPGPNLDLCVLAESQPDSKSQLYLNEKLEPIIECLQRDDRQLS